MVARLRFDVAVGVVVNRATSRQSEAAIACEVVAQPGEEGGGEWWWAEEAVEHQLKWSDKGT